MFLRGLDSHWMLKWKCGASHFPRRNNHPSQDYSENSKYIGKYADKHKSLQFCLKCSKKKLWDKTYGAIKKISNTPHKTSILYTWQ